MTTHAHILDAIREMEKRGIEPSMADFEAMAELLIEDNKEEKCD